MAKLVWFFLRGLVYSVIIFVLLYLFVDFEIIPSLWEGYTNMFTLNTIIVLSIVCGFIFVVIHDLFFRKKNIEKNIKRKR
ncbi:hypothetical protein KBC25_01235 [Candidatus Pacearchaeota archaeon]|jgi:general stress protein CsbA|nr:hypothetical protein [Candidatus Pacearchaeota archaeon]